MHTPAVRFRVDFGRELAVGPGKVALLEQIAASGSLSQAARSLNMSYRRAWQLLESLNSGFAKPVAASVRGGRAGGGATLTPFGRELIQVYRKFDAEIQARAVRRFRPIASQARHAGRGIGKRAPVVPLARR